MRPATSPIPCVRARHGVLAAAVFLAACGSPYGRIVPVGPDTYLMTSHGLHGNTTVGWASAGEQKVQIYEGAIAYCRQQGKAAQMLGERQVDLGWGKNAEVEVQFRCAPQ
jgi:hypothetical protein